MINSNKTKGMYLLSLLTDIKREIICQNVLKENRLGVESKQWIGTDSQTEQRIRF